MISGKDRYRGGTSQTPRGKLMKEKQHKQLSLTLIMNASFSIIFTAVVIINIMIMVVIITTIIMNIIIIITSSMYERLR